MQTFGLVKGARVGLVIDGSAVRSGPQREEFQKDVEVSPRGAGRGLEPPCSPPQTQGTGFVCNKWKVFLRKNSSHSISTCSEIC